jgi:hypothetical protein
MYFKNFSTFLPFPPKVINRIPTIYGTKEISKIEKINEEKRRRNYIYKTLNYLLSSRTYFDFFSIDSFELIKQSKRIASFYNEKTVSLESLFLAFFYSSFQLTNLCEEYNLTKENITTTIENLLQKEKNTNQKKFSLFKDMNKFFENETILEDINFSKEVNNFFEKSSENTVERFKTPIITTEILFLTLLENNDNYFGKIIENLLDDNLNWELFKYKIIKRIHREESVLRDQVSKNQYYFAYLLKSQLTDNEFNQLINRELLSNGVELFRNTLIVQLLETNLFKLLEFDIYKSMKITNKRTYSY